ncbi:MAG: hypothetical protein KDA65_16195, partial [Planctomycetaceae bacterium]|nr:hypothetical protein [Planctomycetaceae bacterium]
EILAALLRCPLTAEEFLKLSQTWNHSFGSLRRAQERLKQLTAVGQLHSWRYATTGPGGGRFYYKLTLAGYRTVLQDDDAKSPTKRFLSEISPGRHRHQQGLSQFVVHTLIAAHQRGIQVVDYYSENTWQIECGERPLFPDGRFTLILPDATRFTYCLELDNSTERILSYKDSDSLLSKMQRYRVDLVASPEEYRVLFVVTGSKKRQEHILKMTRELTGTMSFVPFYVVSLDDYLQEPDALFAPCFQTTQDKAIPLLRSQARQFHSRNSKLETPAVVC